MIEIPKGYKSIKISDSVHGLVMEVWISIEDILEKEVVNIEFPDNHLYFKYFSSNPIELPKPKKA